MLIVQSTPNVRLPTVIDAWEGQHENERIGYLLMEHVEGASVAEIWHGLDIHAREDIQSQLCNFLRQLHTIQLPSPGPIGGAVSCGPLFTDYGAGPFKSKRDMESWFNERLLVCKEFHRAPQTQPLFSGRFENLVMCHMDIAARNLILDRHHKIWVLDWAQAGGYPVYFERAVLRRTGDPDFAEGLLKMLKEEHSEDEERLLAVGFALTTAAHTRPAGVSSVSIYH
ncbi:hypothetical protein MMC17_006757 [Xylographa soralifera]|nr:hypothetical protein [Xylographa soralifera]